MESTNRVYTYEIFLIIACKLSIKRNIFKKDIRRSDRRHILISVTWDFFKEIDQKKMGDVYTLICLRSAELRKSYAIPKYL